MIWILEHEGLRTTKCWVDLSCFAKNVFFFLVTHPSGMKEKWNFYGPYHCRKSYTGSMRNSAFERRGLWVFTKFVYETCKNVFITVKIRFLPTWRVTHSQMSLLKTEMKWKHNWSLHEYGTYEIKNTYFYFLIADNTSIRTTFPLGNALPGNHRNRST